MRAVWIIVFFFNVYTELTAQDPGYYIDRYDVSAVINKDGSAQFTEEITCFFTDTRRGIIRDIPLISEPYGIEKKIEIIDLKVLTHPFKTSKNKKSLKIKIGDPDIKITGRQLYTIQYKIKDVRFWAGDIYTFYYNMIGTQWDTEIKSGRIRISLPQDVDVSTDELAVYSGKKGAATSLFPISKKGNVLDVRVNKAITPGSGVTVGFNYPYQYYEAPPPPAPWWKKQKWALIPGILFAILTGLWLRWGRKRKWRTDEISAVPPTDFNATEVGAFIDSKAQYRDLIALIPRWGEQGLIRLQEGDEELFIVRLAELPTGTPEYQTIFFNGIFKDGDHVAVSKIKGDLFASTYRAQHSLKDYMLDQGLYKSSSYFLFHSGFTIAAILICLAGVVPAIILGQWIAAIILIILAVLLIVQYNQVPALTDRGNELYQQVLRYKNYIKEYWSGDEGETIVPDQLIPYMLVLDLNSVHQGSKRLQSLKGPSWYTNKDGNPFGYTDYHRRWNKASWRSVIATTPAATSSSASRSSGGFSGGSGGGSVGGGAGGGGGSSW